MPPKKNKVLENEVLDHQPTDYTGLPPAVLSAVEDGDVEEVELWLGRKSNTISDTTRKEDAIKLKQTTILMMTQLLQLAASLGQAKMMRMLLKAGADVSKLALSPKEHWVERLRSEVDGKGQLEVIEVIVNNPRNCLAMASDFGCVGAAQLLLERDAGGKGGTCVNELVLGLTPLLFAVEHGYDALVDVLLRHEGTDVNRASEKGFTPVMVACIQGRTKILKTLLGAAGADPSAETPGASIQALHMAASRNEVEAIQLLFDAGADVNCQNAQGCNALAYSASEGALEAGKRLLELGADVHSRDISNFTALSFAARRGFIAMIDLCIGAGASREDANDAMVHAAMGRSPSVEGVQYLIQRADADVNHTDECQRGVLYFAAVANEMELVTFLLTECDVDLEVLNSTHQSSPLNAAARLGHVEMVAMLIDHGRRPAVIGNRDDAHNPLTTPLHTAAMYNQPAVASFLLEHGYVSANAMDGQPESHAALHCAARHDSVEVAKVLLEHGADCRLCTSGEFEQSALHCAAATSQNVQVAQLLLDYGANIEEEDTHALSPIEVASAYGNTTMLSFLLHHAGAHLRTSIYVGIKHARLNSVTFLLREGVDMNVRDPHGSTPLHYAAFYRNVDAAKELLAIGADVGSRNLKQHTPLLTAVFIPNNDKMIALLLERGSASSSLLLYAVDDEGDTPLRGVHCESNANQLLLGAPQSALLAVPL